MEFNLTVFILQLVTFLVGMWLSKIIFLPYLKGWMEARQKRIEDQINTAEKRQKEAEILKAEFEQKVHQLEQNTADILQRTRQEASKNREEVIQTARKEAELILGDARRAIQSERQEILETLKKETVTVAIDIAEKILRAKVDVKAQDKLIQESLQEFGARKN